MVDAKKIGEDANKALRAAISVTGPIDSEDLYGISQNVNQLQASLRYYDRYANDLASSFPDAQDRKEDLNEWIKSRYPADYTDKRYKRMFLRTLYRIPYLLRGRDSDKQRTIQASLDSLTLFKLLFNVVLANSKALIRIARGAEGQQDQQDLQPEEFDEQDAVTNELERELAPQRATDHHQQQTETNVQRRTRRVEPSGKAEDESEYRSMVAKHSQLVENAKNSIRKHKDSIKEVLALADARSFRHISQSARAANALGTSFLEAAQSSRKQMYPGSYTAAKALADFLGELVQIVIDSAPTNRKQRGQMRKRQKAYDKYLETTRVNYPEEG